LKTLFVGNLPFDISFQEVEDAFAEFGEVVCVKIPTDRLTAKPRGFAFVEMRRDPDADAAKRALDQTSLGGRTIIVNDASPRPNRPR
jgi:RNA recognition motif-containing protein